MGDLTTITDASAASVSILTDEVTDGSLGTAKKQLVGIMDATVNSTNKLIVDSSGRAKVDASGVTVPISVADGQDATIGTTTDLEASGNGTVVGLLKRLRTLLNGGLPAALGSNGGLKIETVSDLALDRTTDTSAVTLQSDAIATGSLGGGNLTILTPKFATITASASGATTIVAAVTSKKIRVLSWTLVANGAVNAKWQSHVTPTDKTGLHYFAANGGISVPFSPVGHFETVAGEALDINLSGAVAVGGSLVYVEV